MTKRTKTELAAQVTSNLPDNTAGLIGPDNIRAVFTDVGDSLVFWSDSAPSSITDTGVVGEIKIAGTVIESITVYHLYVCVATNVWRRTELTSF